MKVLQVIPSVAVAHGGPSVAIREMEQALLQQGIQVETATTDDNGPGERLDVVAGIAITEGGVVRRYFRKNLDTYKCSWTFAAWIWRHARDYDVIHIHALFSFVSSIAALAAWRSGVSYVVRPLGTLSAYGLANRRPGPKRLSLALVERPILNRAAAIHCTSAAEEGDVKAVVPQAITAVIPLSVTMDIEPPSRPLHESHPETAGKRILLFLSRLDPKKNLENLLTALQLLRGSDPQPHLIVAGTGDPGYVAGLKRHAEMLGIQDRVSWVGHVTGRAKSELFRGATAFVLPSYSENFGIAVAEALSAGLPCVVGEGVALAQAIREADAGIVVGPMAPEIATGLQRLLARETDLLRLGLNARALAQREFSMATMGQRLRQLYENVMRKANHESN